ncbi:hypothetical protein E2C01_011310 [Portunus trituberculatus]|uniref:Uncharacterized protein n=1 Tax=Portunus trituberculatus TaxID=210409 RepID=A0A5B7DBC0_PORTR|nr:hypothetical protein [Portunus trituberculatus]
MSPSASKRLRAATSLSSSGWKGLFSRYGDQQNSSDPVRGSGSGGGIIDPTGVHEAPQNSVEEGPWGRVWVVVGGTVSEVRHLGNTQWTRLYLPDSRQDFPAPPLRDLFFVMFSPLKCFAVFFNKSWFTLKHLNVKPVSCPHLVNDDVGVQTFIRQSAGQQMPGGHAQGEHIAVASSSLPPQHLRGLISHRPQYLHSESPHVTSFVQPRFLSNPHKQPDSCHTYNVIIEFIKSGTTAEIRYLEVTVYSKEHIGRLEVSVRDTVGMKVCKTTTYLQSEPSE